MHQENGNGTSRSEQDHIAEAKGKVLAAALPHVAFDGWSDRTLADATEEAGVDPGLSRLAFPRGGVDLALAYHWAKDAELAERMAAEDMSALRYSEKVARALEIRLEIIAEHREAVRRAASLFALPQHAADGARAIWHTADTVWNALGDTSEDANWYTKRATLSGVWSATVLYWLGDQDADMAATRGFIARRIADVMTIEKVKAKVRENPLGRALLAGPDKVLGKLRAPGRGPDDLPGRWRN